jgi:sugar phosphate isomerase/epimerase
VGERLGGGRLVGENFVKAKVAFSTLGCPEASLQEILDIAATYGVQGLELRSMAGQIVHAGLSSEERGWIRRRINEAGLHVVCVATYVRVGDPGLSDDHVLGELEAQMLLARDLGAAGVRVFPGGAGTDSDARIARRLAAAALSAPDIRIWLETHDSHPRGTDIRRVMTLLDEICPGHGVQVIWDVLHPAAAGERPATTFEAIGPWFGYAQLKDANFDGQLRLLGQGDIPLHEILILLEDRTEWLSLEWERPWHPELPELAVALAGMRQWFEKLTGP